MSTATIFLEEKEFSYGRVSGGNTGDMGRVVIRGIFLEYKGIKG